MQFKNFKGHIYVVTHIHIVDSGCNDLFQDGFDSFIKRADTVDDQVASGNGALDALRIFGIDF